LANHQYANKDRKSQNAELMELKIRLMEKCFLN